MKKHSFPHLRQKTENLKTIYMKRTTLTEIILISSVYYAWNYGISWKNVLIAINLYVFLAWTNIKRMCVRIAKKNLFWVRISIDLSKTIWTVLPLSATNAIFRFSSKKEGNTCRNVIKVYFPAPDWFRHANAAHRLLSGLIVIFVGGKLWWKLKNWKTLMIWDLEYFQQNLTWWK